MTGSAKLRGVSALPESTAGKRNRRGCRGGTGQSRPGRTARTRRDSDTGGNHCRFPADLLRPCGSDAGTAQPEYGKAPRLRAALFYSV